MQKGARGASAGALLGQGIFGGSRKTPREVHSVHWYPPGGGGGPKKRHLVLYKLAGFCTADIRPCGAFFRLHSSPLVFKNLSKMCTFCHFLAPKPPFWPYLGPFLALFGTPDPLGGARGHATFRARGTRDTGRGRSPPFQGFRRKRQGGGEKIFGKIFYKKKYFLFFFIDHV